MTKPTDQQLLASAQQAVAKLKSTQSDSNWQKFGDSPCQMYRMSVGQRLMSKGITEINMNIDQLFEKIGQIDAIKKINPQCKDIQILHTVILNGKQCQVNYQRYAGIWPVEDRDLVNIGMKVRGVDQCIIATQSVDYPRQQQKKVTRAKCYIGGWILRKIDDSKTKLIYISDVDLCGSIPGMIKNTLAGKQAELPSKVQKALK